MSEYEEEVAAPTEEQLQAARDSTPARAEDDLQAEDVEIEPAPETPEESLLGTPARVEDQSGAVEETAVVETEESESEAFNAEGAGPDSQDHNPS